MTRGTLGTALAVTMLTLAALAPLAGAGEERPTLAEIESEVICPTCHTTLDQSSAPVALRMRAFIRARIAAGDTKSEIKDRLVAQFGEQVLASPPRRGFSLLAWVLPPAAVLVAGSVVAVLAVRWSRRRGERTAGEQRQPTPDDERRVDAELARFDA